MSPKTWWFASPSALLAAILTPLLAAVAAGGFCFYRYIRCRRVKPYRLQPRRASRVALLSAAAAYEAGEAVEAAYLQVGVPVSWPM